MVLTCFKLGQNLSTLPLLTQLSSGPLISAAKKCFDLNRCVGKPTTACTSLPAPPDTLSAVQNLPSQYLGPRPRGRGSVMTCRGRGGGGTDNIHHITNSPADGQNLLPPATHQPGVDHPCVDLPCQSPGEFGGGGRTRKDQACRVF
jgi:hypothetical protein